MSASLIGKTCISSRKKPPMVFLVIANTALFILLAPIFFIHAGAAHAQSGLTRMTDIFPSYIRKIRRKIQSS